MRRGARRACSELSWILAWWTHTTRSAKARFGMESSCVAGSARAPERNPRSVACDSLRRLNCTKVAVAAVELLSLSTATAASSSTEEITAE